MGAGDIVCLCVLLVFSSLGVVPMILVSLGVWFVRWVTRGDFMWKIVRPPSIVFVSIQ